jgi:hypothetical protein
MLCSQANFVAWLQKHLLSCPFKKLTGIDCPGCGFQRSVLALFNGDIRASLHLYPATIPLFLLLVFNIAQARLKFDHSQVLTKCLYTMVGGVIVVSYVCKCLGVGSYH